MTVFWLWNLPLGGTSPPSSGDPPGLCNPWPYCHLGWSLGGWGWVGFFLSFWSFKRFGCLLFFCQKFANVPYCPTGWVVSVCVFVGKRGWIWTEKMVLWTQKDYHSAIHHVSRNQKWRLLLAWVSNPCWGLFQISSHGTVQPSYRAANPIIQLSWCLGCSIGMPPWMVFTFGEKTTWDDLRCIKPRNPVNTEIFYLSTGCPDFWFLPYKEYEMYYWGGVEIMQLSLRLEAPVNSRIVRSEVPTFGCYNRKAWKNSHSWWVETQAVCVHGQNMTTVVGILEAL